MGGRTWWRTTVAAVLGAMLVAGCSTTVAGSGHVDLLALTVHGDSGGAFDTEAKTSLSDIMAFWNRTYPTIAHHAALPPLKGGLYSVNGAELLATRTTPAAVRRNKCLEAQPGFIIDNAAYCRRDDSIIWDRGAGHLLPVLAERYGPTLTALVFAHEFGHAIQDRLHLDGKGVRPIDLESQADCAAGAFAGNALAGRAPHFHIDAAQLDRALEGYFLIRDSTPDTPADATHGDGFDRLNALQLGIQRGAAYCFGPSYLRGRTYTERGYVDPNDYYDQGNQPLGVVLGRDGIAPDLNRFWRSMAGGRGRSFRPVRLVEAAHPPCAPQSEFGYCPDDNTVYYSAGFARRAYYSITDVVIDKTDATVQLQQHQPGDYALGFLLAVAWGMAARAQLDHAAPAGQAALRSAICYAGAYSENINRAQLGPAHKYILSPPDMDEATSATLSLVDLNSAFGARGTTALERIQSFVTGYDGGLAACR